jgi:hypothetical protein
MICFTLLLQLFPESVTPEDKSNSMPNKNVKNSRKTVTAYCRNATIKKRLQKYDCMMLKTQGFPAQGAYFHAQGAYFCAQEAYFYVQVAYFYVQMAYFYVRMSYFCAQVAYFRVQTPYFYIQTDCFCMQMGHREVIKRRCLHSL